MNSSKIIFFLLALTISISMFLVFLIIGKNDTPTKPKHVLRHVVLFGFKPEVNESQVKEIVDAFNALPSQINLIKAFESGVDSSPEGLQKGLTHCFTVTFYSDKDRDAYLVHPSHQAFSRLLKDKLSAITVVDYWASLDSSE